MRLRLVGVLSLFFALGCMCGDFQEGFEVGKNQALTQSFVDSQAKLLELPNSPPRKRMLELTERGQVDAAAGKLDLVEASVFVGELEAAISDGEVTMEEADAMTTKYNAMVGG